MIEADFAQFTDTPMLKEILAEQVRVEWSDSMVFIFPIWWWSFPAILKGWIDRVITYGWAYKDPKDPSSGNLKPRKILVLTTAGGSKAMFEKRKYDEALYTQINVGTWDYCNFKDVTTEILYEVGGRGFKKISQSYLDRCKYLANSLLLNN